LLLKPEGNGKLSKRDGDRLGFPVFTLQWTDPESGEVSSGYREKGYYPEAFVNMLALLGWNPGSEQELFSMQELIDSFTMDHVHKSGARFDPEKTRWFNEQYLRRQTDHDIARRIQTLVRSRFGLEESDHRLGIEFLSAAVALLKDRVQFEHEMVDSGSYLFIAPTAYDQTVIAKKWKPELGTFFNNLSTAFQSATLFDRNTIDSAIKNCASENGIKPGEIMQLLRVLVSGQAGGVDLIGMIQLLGADESARRIKSGLESIPR
jgi:glutamyl-tRNA synthetase